MSSKPIVLQLGNIKFAQDAWTNFEQIANVVRLDTDTDRQQFLARLKDPNDILSKVEVICRTYHSVAQTGRFDKELAYSLPSTVKAICHTGAGYDQVETQWFDERQIQVSNVPTIVNDATAVTHVFLLLGAMRKYEYGHRVLLEGKWPEKRAGGGGPFGNDPDNKTVGILGFGGIGRAIVERLKPFGFKRFVYHNRSKLPEDLEGGCEYLSFDEFLKVSDIISVSVPLNKNTRHMIDSDAIAKMKDGVVIVNTARGPVIDEKALIENLKSGKIASAGLDVFENEPEVPQELIDMPQVLALPHMGTYCVETLKRMEEHVVQNAKEVIQNGRVISIVPELKDKQWFKEL